MGRDLRTFVAMLMLGLAGCAGHRSGPGDVEYVKFAESGEAESLTRYIVQREEYPDARELTGARIEDVLVAKHDLNDDGVPELILYLEMSSYYCGSGGCSIVILQKVGDAWREIGGLFGSGLWVSDEKVGGYRTIYSYRGTFLRWKGEGYGTGCTTDLPPEAFFPERPPAC